VPSGVRGEATGKCGSSAFRGWKNQLISTFHSWLAVFSFWSCAQNHFTIVFFVLRPLQHPINYPPADMSKNLYSDLRLHLGIDSVENSVAKRRNRFIKRYGETDNDPVRFVWLYFLLRLFNFCWL